VSTSWFTSTPCTKSISIAVSKRSADPLPDAGKYAQFMGKGVIEYDLANIAEVEAYEANEANQQA